MSIVNMGTRKVVEDVTCVNAAQMKHVRWRCVIIASLVMHIMRMGVELVTV